MMEGIRGEQKRESVRLGLSTTCARGQIMTITSRWPARIALLIGVAMVAAVMGAWDARGGSGDLLPVALQTTASPTPSEEPCEFEPAPPPICPEPEPEPEPSPSPSGSQPPGGEEPERHASEITIRYVTPAFKGIVKTATKCKDQRQVVVRRIRQGPDALVGRDTTGADGKWNVRESGADGRYYAKVLKRSFTSSGNQIVCQGDRSETRRV